MKLWIFSVAFSLVEHSKTDRGGHQVCGAPEELSESTGDTKLGPSDLIWSLPSS